MRRAYILTEILISMLIQAMFIVVLSGAFYMMLTFYTRTQQIQTARNRGKRVIEYVDQRIKGAGLGLWRCESSEEITQNILKVSGIKGVKMNVPISITTNDNPSTNAYHKDGNTYKGNVLTLLYAYRDYDTDSKAILNVSGSIYRNETPTEGISINNISGFKIVGASAVYLTDYVVMEGTGLPMYIKPDKKINFHTANTVSYHKSADIHAGSELLHLECERMFVEEDSFSFKTLDYGWSQSYRHETGILDLYMELDTHIYPYVLDLWVLSTGGRDRSRTTPRPTSWPISWKTSYEHEVVYVSRASWKLHNIPKDFVFSYQ